MLIRNVIAQWSPINNGILVSKDGFAETGFVIPVHEIAFAQDAEGIIRINVEVFERVVGCKVISQPIDAPHNNWENWSFRDSKQSTDIQFHFLMTKNSQEVQTIINQLLECGKYKYENLVPVETGKIGSVSLRGWGKEQFEGA